MNKNQRVYQFIRAIKHGLTHAGTQAVIMYRIGNWFYRHHVPLLPLLIDRTNLFLTGAEIPSCVEIGRGFTVKHSVGIVIGPTSEIGERVTFLHGVTLGSVDFNINGKRHPTVKDGVLIGAGAILLGGIVIGENAIIGAGAVVVEDVPPHSVVRGPKAVINTQVGETIPTPNIVKE